MTSAIVELPLHIARTPSVWVICAGKIIFNWISGGSGDQLLTQKNIPLALTSRVTA
jgi:hypothetical protein